MRVVVPSDYTNYVLLIDNGRSYAKVKALFLKHLLTICEWLAN